MSDERPQNFSDHQTGIYAGGMFGDTKPEWTTNLAELEEQARDELSDDALSYVVASAGSGSTARTNRDAFERWRIVPRMLQGSPQRDLSCTVLGSQMPAPLVLAPVGVQTLGHPEGELASARAAAELGLTYIHSTQASKSFEDVAEANGDGSRWYQLYWPTDDDVCISFLERAKASGFTTLVLTLDTSLLGWRPADLDRGYLPFLANVGIENYLTDEAFMEPIRDAFEENPAAAALRFGAIFPNPGLSWERIPFLREHWDGPIALKGILSLTDAKRAVEHGLDGIVVSNHGGRQVDGAIASLDALPAIAEAVGDELTVLFDSGVRTGADAFKALALGADAVLIGRPFLYGLALGGQAGVEHVMRCLLAELDLTIALAGHRSHTELTPDALARGTS